MDELFPVRITAATDVAIGTGTHKVYSWIEQSTSSEGTLEDAYPARKGTYSTDGVDPALCLSDGDVAVGATVWLRFRCLAPAFPFGVGTIPTQVFEFMAPASSTSYSGAITAKDDKAHSFASIGDVKLFNAVAAQVRGAGTVDFTIDTAAQFLAGLVNTSNQIWSGYKTVTTGGVRSTQIRVLGDGILGFSRQNFNDTPLDDLQTANSLGMIYGDFSSTTLRFTPPEVDYTDSAFKSFMIYRTTTPDFGGDAPFEETFWGPTGNGRYMTDPGVFYYGVDSNSAKQGVFGGSGFTFRNGLLVQCRFADGDLIFGKAYVPSDRSLEILAIGTAGQVLTVVSGFPGWADPAPVAYADVTGTPTLAAVATSGDYADLINQPVATAVADSTDTSDAAIQLNALLAALRTAGLVAP